MVKSSVGVTVVESSVVVVSSVVVDFSVVVVSSVGVTVVASPVVSGVLGGIVAPVVLNTVVCIEGVSSGPSFVVVGTVVLCGSAVTMSGVAAPAT